MTATIRQCTSGDLPRLFELFAEHYKANPALRRRQHFDWQFQDSPWNDTDGYTMLLCEDGDDITGFLGYLPLELVEGDNISQGCWTMNWIAQKNDGAGMRLLHALMERFDNRIHIGLSDDSVGIYTAYRIPYLERIPRMVAFPDAKQAIALFGGEGEAHIRKTSSKLTEHKVQNGIKFKSRLDNDTEFRPDPSYGIRGHVRRSGRYVNWRYVDIPDHNYRIISDDSDGLGVYRVEKVMDTDCHVCRILEWTFGPTTSSDAVATLLDAEDVRTCALMDFFCTSKALCATFETLGFISERQYPVPYLFRPMTQTDGIRIAIDMPPHLKTRDFPFSDWYVTKGDSDQDRIKL